jgi:hypothetical protein
VNENRPAGTVVGTLSTADPDAGDSHTYSLVDQPGVCNGPDNTAFQISGDDLMTNAVFDYETRTSYVICIMTDDSRGGTLQKQITIAVLNINLDQENSYAIRYANWIGVLDVNAYGGGYRTAQTGLMSFKPGSKKFTSLKVIMYRGPDQGKAQILVDGKVNKTVDLYNATPQWNYQVPVDKLSSAAHTIAIKALNKKQNASSGKQIRVDGFIIKSTTYDDNSSSVTSLDSWSYVTNRAANGGSYRISSKKASALYSFSGTQTSWITAQGPAYGKAAIYVDGMLAQTVDLYSKATHWNYLVSIIGLSNGPHVLEIRVLGTRNLKSKGASVIIDAVGMQ